MRALTTYPCLLAGTTQLVLNISTKCCYSNRNTKWFNGFCQRP